MRILKGAALLSTFAAALPSAAHLLELPGKAGLSPATYFEVQSIYAGWAWFAIPVLLAVVLNAWLGTALLPRDRLAAASALSAASLTGATIAIFFTAIDPANRFTREWTSPTAGWQNYRASWEHGHAISALLLIVALVLTTIAAVRCSDTIPKCGI
jgi:hypothetical protein